MAARVALGKKLIVAIRGALPLGLPDTLTRSPLRRLAPFAWLGRCAPSLVSRRGASGLRRRRDGDGQRRTERRREDVSCHLFAPVDGAGGILKSSGTLNMYIALLTLSIV